MNNLTCGTYSVPPLRAELNAAYAAMDATHHPMTYAICRTSDGQAWEVNIRSGNIDSALEERYTEREAAQVAGDAWLQRHRHEGAV